MDMSAAAGLGREELERELAVLAAHLSAGMCRWLELLGELESRGGWAVEGPESCAGWVAWRCGLAERSAREHVRVARRLRELPLTRAAFGRGVVSYAKVRALTRVATAESEEDLLQLGRVLTAAELERTVRCYRRLSTVEAREQLENAFLSVFWNPDGSLELHGRLAPEDGALLLRALEARRDLAWKDGGGSAEPRPARQASRAEALVAVCEASLAYSGQGRSGAERYQVVVHADEQALTDDPTVTASWRTAARWRRRRRAGWAVTLLWSETGGGLGRSRRRSGGRCSGVTGAVVSRAVRTAVSSMRITSSTGRRVAKRRWTTWCCSAAATTAPSMRAATRSTGRDGSSTPGGWRSSPHPSCRRATPNS